MKKLSALAACALAALALAACSESTSSTTQPGAQQNATAQPQPQVDMAALSQTKGFNVGALMSAKTVYVFFDAQCPHCGHLWDAAKPLQSQAKFVWIPVAVLNRASLAQGATLLAAADAVKAMDEHEQLLTARRGGISANGDSDALRAVVEANTKVLNGFNVESIPFIVMQDPATGKAKFAAGALPTAELAQFIGAGQTDALPVTPTPSVPASAAQTVTPANPAASR